MTTNLSQLVQEKAKAIAAGGSLVVVGIAEWAVQDSTIAAQIQHVIPAPYNLLVPGVLAAAGTWLVHHVPNAQPVAVTFTEPTTETSIVRLSAVNGGEFTGTAAH